MKKKKIKFGWLKTHRGSKNLPTVLISHKAHLVCTGGNQNGEKYVEMKVTSFGMGSGFGVAGVVH